MATYVTLDSALGRAGARIDCARQNLYYCDVGFMQKGTRQLRHDVHASAYVYVAAAMESYVTELLNAVIDEINARALSLRDLRLSLFAMVHGSHLEALQVVRGLKMWARRADIFEDVDSAEVCQLSSAHLPLDGGTIRPSHLETIWGVLGANGTSMPSPRHRLALTDLADSRNALAHGEDDPAVVAGKKSIPDTLRLLERVEEIVIHLHYSMVDYLDNSLFLR
jgi:HEPN superfamily protein